MSPGYHADTTRPLRKFKLYRLLSDVAKGAQLRTPKLVGSFNIQSSSFDKQWKSSCGVVVSVLASYTSDPGFDPRECLVGFGCFFTVLAILLGLCDVSTQIVVRCIVLIYPGSCNVQSYETICSEVVISKSKNKLYSLRIENHIYCKIMHKISCNSYG